MNATCFAAGIRSAHGDGIGMRPVAANRHPISPAVIEVTPMQPSSTPIGFQSSVAPNFGRDPTRATSDNGTPSINPTHHVATVPQPNARSVGFMVEKTGGWAIVNYSTQIRVVT